MADEQSVRILLSGIQEWNSWRQKNPNESVDLTNAKLAYVSLSGKENADMRRVNLSGAETGYLYAMGVDFQETILTKAIFYSADFVHANFRNCDLRGTRFTESDLRDCNLSGADLTGADLAFANLTRANLKGTNFDQASFLQTYLTHVDLSDALGLETCKILGPNFLDPRTLLLSKSLSQDFLRKCGLPDIFIEYLPSLRGIAVEFYSCFVSYSTADQEFADRLYADLQSQGVRCWFAPEDLKIGDRFRQRIDDAIRLHDKLVLLLSEHSIKSDWVREEVESCLEREHLEKRSVLFPLRLDDTVMSCKEAWAASIRRQRHLGDFKNWKNYDSYKKAFDRLLRDLKAS